MAYAAPFPLSSSRTPHLPAPVCTLPPLTHTNSYSSTPRHSPETSLFSAFGSTDSYFTPALSPSSLSSSPSPSSEPRKRTSIPSLLASPDLSGNESHPSSPRYNWSNNTSPSTAPTSRGSSVEHSPMQLPSFNPNEFSGIRYNPDDNKMFSLTSVNQSKIQKQKPAPRAPVPNEKSNRDGYDCLGRKKPKTPRTPMSWDPKDDILLKQLKEEQRLGWKEIATHFRGRTSHACQFRWRRLASGQLKYYQGHRRPPTVTTTAASFASEMASVSAPSTHHNSMSPNPTSHSLPPPMPMHHHNPHHHTAIHTPVYNNPWIYQPTPIPTPTHYAPRFFTEWSQQEDNILLNRKLSFDEVNVLLGGRSEGEIWQRMVKLRGNEAHEAYQQHHSSQVPGIALRH